jgi:hypothetical protein
MWPFKSKRAGAADRAIGVLDDAISAVAEKWLHFSAALKFKDEVTLGERIAADYLSLDALGRRLRTPDFPQNLLLKCEPRHSWLR